MRVAQNEIGLVRWTAPSEGTVLPAAGACGFEPETAAPPNSGVNGEPAPPLVVQRDADGQPLGAAFKANTVRPDEVPGAYGAWLKDQL